METTQSRFARSGWLKLAALALLASVPFLLPKPAPASPSDGDGCSLEVSSDHTQHAAVSVADRDRHVSSAAGQELKSSKPSKVRVRNPGPENDEIAAQQAFSDSSSNSDEVQGQRGSGARSVTRRQRQFRDDGSIVEQGHDAFQSSGTRSQPAFTRPPGMPISHLIDDDVAAQVAPEVPPDTMEAIRQTFEQEAGVNELAQDDPVYAQRWSKAELDAGERIRAMYGWAAFDEFQRKLVMEQLEGKKAQGGQ
jgi:hypothetical protein